MLLAGSGDGVIDAAAAGLVDGTGLLAYTASLDDQLLQEQLAAGAALIVTDSNRDRAHHWRTSQDVTGFTEGPGTALLVEDPYDQRLPVFPDDHPDEQTLAVQRGPVVATATSYGEPNAYRPEDRPFMAVDGDPSTAWVTADRAQATGEAIQVTAEQSVSSLTLTQPDDPFAVRWITRVRVTTDAGDSVEVDLDPALRTIGQQVELPDAGHQGPGGDHGDEPARQRLLPRPERGRVQRGRPRPRAGRRGGHAAGAGTRPRRPAPRRSTS